MELVQGDSEVNSDLVREKLEEYLAGCAAVRDGNMDVFFMLGTGIQVTQSNVDEIEAGLRNHFSDKYPDLIQ